MMLNTVLRQCYPVVLDGTMGGTSSDQPVVSTAIGRRSSILNKGYLEAIFQYEGLIAYDLQRIIVRELRRCWLAGISLFVVPTAQQQHSIRITIAGKRDAILRGEREFPRGGVNACDLHEWPRFLLYSIQDINDLDPVIHMQPETAVVAPEIAERQGQAGQIGATGHRTLDGKDDCAIFT